MAAQNNQLLSAGLGGLWDGKFFLAFLKLLDPMEFLESELGEEENDHEV